MNEKNLNAVQIRNDIVNLEKPFLQPNRDHYENDDRNEWNEWALQNKCAQFSAIRFDLMLSKTSNHSDTHLTSRQ